MKFSFIELPWCFRQSVPTNFYEFQYYGWSSRMPTIVSIYS